MTTGFLFLAEPRFADIAAAFAAFSARGYRHRARPLWALDLWEKPWRKQARHFPFQERFAARASIEVPPLETEAPVFLRELETLAAALGTDGDPIATKECRIALGVSRLAGAPTFFFAGDDDLADLACLSESGRLERFRCRLGRLTVIHEQGRSGIVPSGSLDDDEEADLERLIAAARAAVDWPVSPPVAVDGGRPLHESALALWPRALGEPGEPLGVGTFDPLQNLDADFDVVFERTGG